MLILSRYRNEEIVIVHNKTGDQLTIIMVQPLCNRAKLGFLDELGNFTFVRKELTDDVQNFSKKGSKTSVPEGQ